MRAVLDDDQLQLWAVTGALAALEGEVSDKDRDFYTGKVAAAQFFARQVLPRLAAERAMAEATDNELMDVPESAF